MIFIILYHQQKSNIECLLRITQTTLTATLYCPLEATNGKAVICFKQRDSLSNLDHIFQVSVAKHFHDLHHTSTGFAHCRCQWTANKNENIISAYGLKNLCVTINRV